MEQPLWTDAQLGVDQAMWEMDTADPAAAEALPEGERLSATA